MSGPSRSGVPIYADTTALARFSRSLRQVSPEAWKTMRKALLEAAGPLLSDMQSRVSYSSRIGESGSIRVTAGGNVKIVFTAPNAAPIENKGDGFVRHPTYSPRPHVPERVGWTDENSHPAFAAPALDAQRAAITERAVNAVRDAAEAVMDRGIGGV